MRHLPAPDVRAKQPIPPMGEAGVVGLFWELIVILIVVIGIVVSFVDIVILVINIVVVLMVAIVVLWLLLLGTCCLAAAAGAAGEYRIHDQARCLALQVRSLNWSTEADPAVTSGTALCSHAKIAWACSVAPRLPAVRTSSSSNDQ